MATRNQELRKRENNWVDYSEEKEEDTKQRKLDFYEKEDDN